MYLKKQTNKGGEKRDKVKPMQSRFFFLPSIKNGSMMHFILPWIHHVQGFRRVLQILWFPKKFNFRFGFKQYVLLSYLKALDATDDVPVFTGRSKFPKLQGTGCKNSLRHVSSTNRLTVAVPGTSRRDLLYRFDQHRNY